MCFRSIDLIVMSEKLERRTDMGNLIDSYIKSGIIAEPLPEVNVQECVNCNEATGRCEDDTLYLEDGYGPLCEECYDLSMLSDALIEAGCM